MSTDAGSERRRSRLLNVAVAGALALVTVVAFARVGGHGFVNYDDPLYLTQNEMVQRGLSAETLSWSFATVHAANWHPLTWVSILVDVELFGMDARGHHWMALALHVLNTVLFFWLTLRTTGSRWAAAFAAALFGWHPLRVEAVAWLSQRKDLLSMLFALLALLAYERHARRPSLRWMLAVVLATAAGLLAKPVLVTLPFALLLLDRWPLRRISSPQWLAIDAGGAPWARASFGALIREKTALFALVIVSSLLTLAAQRGGGAVNEEVPWLARLLNAATSYTTYVAKTLWPSGLSPHYPYPSVIELLPAAVAAGALVVVTWITWRERNRLPFLLTGWLFFLGTLVPMIGLVQVGSQAMADRYTYFAGIGLFWILAFGGERLLAALRVPIVARALLCAAVLGALLFATRVQVAYWRDSVTLFTRAVEIDGHNHVALGNLAAALIERGDDAAGQRYLEQATELRPELPELWINLGTIAARQGRHQEALGYYERALEARPGDLSASLNFALSCLHLGRTDEAIPLLERVVREQAQGNLEKLLIAHRALASAYQTKGRKAEAEAQLRAVRQIQAGRGPG